MKTIKFWCIKDVTDGQRDSWAYTRAVTLPVPSSISVSAAAPLRSVETGHSGWQDVMRCALYDQWQQVDTRLMFTSQWCYSGVKMWSCDTDTDKMLKWTVITKPEQFRKRIVVSFIKCSNTKYLYLFCGDTWCLILDIAGVTLNLNHNLCPPKICFVIISVWFALYFEQILLWLYQAQYLFQFWCSNRGDKLKFKAFNITQILRPHKLMILPINWLPLLTLQNFIFSSLDTKAFYLHSSWLK